MLTDQNAASSFASGFASRSLSFSAEPAPPPAASENQRSFE